MSSNDIVKELAKRGFKNLRFKYDRYEHQPAPKGFWLADKLGITKRGFLVSNKLKPLSEIRKNGLQPYRFGGRVSVEGFLPNGDPIPEGVYYELCSHKDRFVKEFGRRIAIGRLAKRYNVTF